MKQLTMELILIIIVLVIYFIPTLVGMKKRNAGAIFTLNLLLGWTLLGWIIALVWALTVDQNVSHVPIKPQVPIQQNKNTTPPLEELLEDSLLVELWEYCRNFVMQYPKATLITLTIVVAVSVGGYRIHEHYEGQRYLAKVQYQDSLKTAELVQIWGPNYKLRMDSAKKADDALKPFNEVRGAHELLYDISRTDFSSAAAFNVVVGNFNIVARIIKSYKKSSDKKLAKEVTALEKKLIAHQKKWFPFLRKKYIKFGGQTLWENDIEVHASGTGNTVINLVGYHFASNSGISSTHSTLSDMLRQLRFKRANYKFSEYGEYSYYDIPSLKDSDIQ